MVFKCINKLFRDLLFVLRLRKKKILVFSNHPSDYSDPFDDFRIISELKSSKFSSPELCSHFSEFVLNAGKGFEIVHIAVHGKEGAFDISDNELNIRHSRLSGLFLNNIKTELVFLNVCESDQLAQQLSKSVQYVIGWSNNPPQEDCKQLCEDFYKYVISSNESIIGAYNRSSVGKQDCRLFVRSQRNGGISSSYVLKSFKSLFLTLILTGLIIGGTLFLRAKVSPTIIEPDEKSEIFNPVKIVISAPLLGEKSKLWILVGTPGYKDVWWPQGKAEKTEGQWKLVVNCGNESDYGNYKICAMVVNTNTDEDLLKWIDSQSTDSKMEPLADLPSRSFWYKYDIISVKRTN